MKNLNGLILAGGKGTRLRPLTHTIPKQLAPIANRPILHYVVDQLKNVGVSNVVVIVSPETDNLIKTALSSNPWNINFTFIVQPEPLGLAHALLMAETHLMNSPFVMYLGDNLLEEPLSSYLDEFNKNQCDALLLTTQVKDPTKFGVLIFDGENNLIDLIEKPKSPPSNWVLIGVYFFTPKIFDFAKKIKPSNRGEYEITDTIKELLKNNGKIKVSKLKGWWLDTGKKDDLLVANLKVLKSMTIHQVKGKISTDSEIAPPATIGISTVIENSKIIGPVNIGNSVTIKESTIGPFVSIGNNSLIENANLKKSVLFDETHVESVTLNDSILGRRAKITGSKRSNQILKVFISDDSEIEL